MATAPCIKCLPESESKLWDQSEIGSGETDSCVWDPKASYHIIIIIKKICTVAGELGVQRQQCLCSWRGRAAVDSWCSPTPACMWAPRQSLPAMPMQLRLWLGQWRKRTREGDSRACVHWSLIKLGLVGERQIDNVAKRREIFTVNVCPLRGVFQKRLQVFDVVCESWPV